MIRRAQEPVTASRNVLGGQLEVCSTSPMTGFYRTGCCDVGPDDAGVHAVCVQVTAEFLAFSKAAGNDLSTPMPQHGFAGIKPGDRWCLCAARWKQALDAGAVPFHDPMPQPWGRSARYADHDGNIIELTEPGSPPQ